MLRLSAPLVFGLILGRGGEAAAGEHDPADDHGQGNDGWHKRDGGGPCAGGDWGSIGAPRSDWVHVSALNGNDHSGDGTLAHPFETVAAAVEAARVVPTGHQRVLALWPGNYDAAVLLLPGEGWDDRVVFRGCSAAETTLTASDPDAPVIDAAVPQWVGVFGIGIIGGTDALTARDGATVEAHGVTVSGSRNVGIAAFGDTTVLTMYETAVNPPAADGCGWGVASWGATTTLVDSTVSGARGAGVFAEGGSLAINGGSIVDTSPELSLRYGRAVHAQSADVSIIDTYVSAATDASLFLLDPIAGTIRGVIIDATAAGVVGQETTGDAIVIVGGVGGDGVHVRNNWVYDAERAALLFEGANVDVAGNTFSGAGIAGILGADALSQGQIHVHGADAADVLWLSPGDELAIDRDPMVCVQ
jgi:hypothetical protein